MLEQHAKTELEKAGYFKEDSFYGGHIGTAVMELVGVFAKQGHSGGSAPIVASLFKTLADCKPLMPITGDDDEWVEVGPNVFQNKRLGSLFKEGKDGIAHYIDAIVFCPKDGGNYTGTALDSNGEKIYSRQNVKFPFMPKTFYVDVIGKEITKDDWEHTIKDMEQLDEVFKYYDKYTI